MKLKLKAIKFNVDFRKTEWTNYEEFKRSKFYPGNLNKNEAFLFVSKSLNQLMWILNVENVADKHTRPKTVVDSRRWRMLHSTWNPLMLQNYANEVDIELVGIRQFKELYKKSK